MVGDKNLSLTLPDMFQAFDIHLDSVERAQPAPPQAGNPVRKVVRGIKQPCQNRQRSQNNREKDDNDPKLGGMIGRFDHFMPKKRVTFVWETKLSDI